MGANDDEPSHGVADAPRPAGKGDYVVRTGDSMSSIADAHGFFWETLWALPANAELKDVRGNPELLLPGDRVTIPDKRRKVESCTTDALHRFRRRGIPVKIGFRVAAGSGQVFAHKRYQLEVGDRRYEGLTDDDGALEHWVAPVADFGILTVWLDEKYFPPTATWKLRVGQLPPIDTLIGVQARLVNLGYRCAKTSVFDDDTKAALEAFQRKHGLDPTGECDDVTRSKLAEICKL